MAYTKNTWSSGDVVTAAKLNNLEDGVEEALSGGGGGAGGGDVLVVPVTATLDSGGAATYSTSVSVADVASAVADSVPVLYALTTDVDNMITQSTSYAVASVPGFAVVVMFNSATDSFSPIVLYHTADGISDQDPAPH